MRKAVTKISKSTLKIILKIIYEITYTYCIWYQHQFPSLETDWDHPLDEWSEPSGFGDDQEKWMHIGTGEDL